MASPQTKTNGTKPTAAKSAPQTRNSSRLPRKINPNRTQPNPAPHRYLVGDLIAHGGQEDDLDSVIFAAAQRQSRPILEFLRDNQPDEYSRQHSEFTGRYYKQWKADLLVAHRNNPGPDFPTANTTRRP